MPNINMAPEDFGLTVVGEVSWTCDSYSYDKTIIWKDAETGQLFYYQENGCSCPTPFDGVGRTHITAVDKSQQLIDLLLNQRKETDPNVQGRAAELVLKAKREFKNWQARQRRAAKKEEAVPDTPQTVEIDTQATPEQAAHVLGYLGQPGGYPPGDWTRDLISVMDRADFANSARLRGAFPGYGDALHMFKYDPDGLAKLQVIATTPAKKGN
jgi:hypothetical protein